MSRELDVNDYRFRGGFPMRVEDNVRIVSDFDAGNGGYPFYELDEVGNAVLTDTVTYERTGGISGSGEFFIDPLPIITALINAVGGNIPAGYGLIYASASTNTGFASCSSSIARADGTGRRVIAAGGGSGRGTYGYRSWSASSFGYTCLFQQPPSSSILAGGQSGLLPNVGPCPHTAGFGFGGGSIVTGSATCTLFSCTQFTVPSVTSAYNCGTGQSLSAGAWCIAEL